MISLPLLVTMSSLAAQPETLETSTEQAVVPAMEAMKAMESVKSGAASKSMAPAPQEESFTLKPGVQIRARLEKAFQGNLGVPRAVGALKGASNFKTTQRTRPKLKINGDCFSGLVSVQDVRTWASETNTLSDFSAEDLDFHEAWAQVGTDTFVRVGRQEFILDGHRLLGSVNWTQQGRSFDGIRITHQQKNFRFTLFASRVADGALHDLIAFNAWTNPAGIYLSVPLIVQTNAPVQGNKRGPASKSWERITGGIYAKQKGLVDWRVEAYLQGGKDGNTSTKHLAYMVGARVGYGVNALLKPTLWVDYLSGDNNPADSKTKAFDTLFATNHKFYGFADRFLNIPAHTKQGGLIDLSIKNTSKVGPGKLQLALHEFLLATKTQPYDATGKTRKGRIGAEVDVVYAMPLVKHVSLVLGASVFFDQGGYASARDKASHKTIHDWFFAQLDLNV